MNGKVNEKSKLETSGCDLGWATITGRNNTPLRAAGKKAKSHQKSIAWSEMVKLKSCTTSSWIFFPKLAWNLRRSASFRIFQPHHPWPSTKSRYYPPWAPIPHRRTATNPCWPPLTEAPGRSACHPPATKTSPRGGCLTKGLKGRLEAFKPPSTSLASQLSPSPSHPHHPIIASSPCTGRLLLKPQFVGEAVDLLGQRCVIAADLQQLLLRHARGAQLTDLVLQNQLIQQINGYQSELMGMNDP